MNRLALSLTPVLITVAVVWPGCAAPPEEVRGPDGARLLEFDAVRTERMVGRWRSLSRVAREELSGDSVGGLVVVLNAGHVSPQGRLDTAVWTALRELPRLRGLIAENVPIESAGLEAIHELAELELVDLSGTAVDDAGLKHLSQLKHLRAIDLGFTRISAKGIAHLSKLEGLRTLMLEGRQISDAWLAAVGQLETIHELHITDAQISDAGLAELAALGELRALALGGTPITGAGLAHLRCLRNLRLLDVYDTALDNDGLATISSLNQLRALSIEFCGSVTGDGLVHLRKLSGLHGLSLRQTGFRNRFDGTILEHIAPLERLRVLDLFATAVDDSALVHLTSLVELRELELSLANVTDPGLVHIAGLPRLEKLAIDSHAGFSKPIITDEGLKTIARLRTLESLSLVGASVTPSAVRELESALPRLGTVRREGGDLTSPVVPPRTTAVPPDAGGFWPGWRGPNRNGQSMETGLLTSWQPDGPPLVWSVSTVGKGWASVAVVDGTVYTLGKEAAKSEDETSEVFVIALAVRDGSSLWKRVVSRTNRNVMSTPVVDSGLVFALDPNGELFCLDTKTGEQVWSRDYVDDFGGTPPSERGFAETPLVDGDQLICTPGGQHAGVVALEARTGELIWTRPLPVFGPSEREGPSFASPLVTDIGGRHVCVVTVGRGVAVMDAGDGTFLCGYGGLDGIAISTPVLHEDLIFCSIGYGTGSALIKLLPNTSGGLDVEEQYSLPGGRFQNQHGGFVLVSNSVFGGHGSNNGLPTCIDVATGDVLWKARGPGTGSAAVIYADGHLFFRYQDGNMALIEASRDGYRLKGSFRVPGAGRERWAHPAIAGKRLYLREHDHLFVYDVGKP